jgi:hypothetical protein
MTSCLTLNWQELKDCSDMLPMLKSKSALPRRWKRLQIRRKNRNVVMTNAGTIANGASNIDQYRMLDDSEYEEEQKSENFLPTQQCVVINQDMMSIPQWTPLTTQRNSVTTNDIGCSSDDDDIVSFCEDEKVCDDTSMGSTEPITQNSRPTMGDLIGAFPNYSSRVSERSNDLTPLSIDAGDTNDASCVHILLLGENHLEIHCTDANESSSTANVSDSETEEDSSLSMSSMPEDGANDKSMSHTKDNDDNHKKERRSIRFCDEIVGQSLATVHFVPWSEHADPDWIPRPVRCRIEL